MIDYKVMGACNPIWHDIEDSDFFTVSNYLMEWQRL